MNSFLSSLKEDTNYKLTENGALSHSTTGSHLYDLFALGGAYRNRSEEDMITLFKSAYEENPSYAMKCLFYLRDCHCGQGERHFFRVCYDWLLREHLRHAKENLQYFAEYGRWDDLLYVCQNNKTAWKNAMDLVVQQLREDSESLKKGDKTPVSLLAKWLPSENTSSAKTRALAAKVIASLRMKPKQYRKMLTLFRNRINIVETLMSQNRWDEIEFGKLPSKAGMKYRKCYANREETKERYAEFMSSKTTKVNASTLVPAEVVRKARGCGEALNSPARLAINKYWDNLTDYFRNKTFNGMAVVDTSASMLWGSGSLQPMDVAVSLGMYCAEKASGPFHGHYISFSRKARLVEVKGADFVDKVNRIVESNLCENTNIHSVFQLVLDTAVNHHMKQEDLPQNLIIISDMEFDRGQIGVNRNMLMTEMETWHKLFSEAGYTMPKLIYWNVNARNDNISDLSGNVSFVSGSSPVLFEQIMSGKTGYDLMMDKLNSERYAVIR